MSDSNEPLLQSQKKDKKQKKTGCCPCFSSKKPNKNKNKEQQNNQNQQNKNISQTTDLKGMSMQEQNNLYQQNQSNKISNQSDINQLLNNTTQPTNISKKTSSNQTQYTEHINYSIKNESLVQNKNPSKLSEQNHDSELRDHFGSIHDQNNYQIQDNALENNQQKLEYIQRLTIEEDEANSYLKKYPKNELVLLNNNQYDTECIIGKITEKNLSFKNSITEIKQKPPISPNSNQYSKRYFFSQHSRIKILEEYYESVTPEVISTYIAKRAEKCSIILDAFCGIGGNTIQFAKNSDIVFANDISQQCTEFTKHNCDIYKVAHKVEFIQGDYFNLKSLRPDLTFLSPQYNKGYEFDGRIDLFENFVPDLQTSLKFALKQSKNIMLFLPVQADISQIPSLFSKLFEQIEKIKTISVEIEKIMVNDQLEYFLVYYGQQITNIKGYQEQDLIQKLLSGKKNKKGVKNSFMENNGLRQLLETIKDKIGINKLLNYFLQVYNENKDTEKEFIDLLKQEKVINDVILNSYKETSITKSYTQSHGDEFINDLYNSQNKSQFVSKQGGHNTNRPVQIQKENNKQMRNTVKHNRQDRKFQNQELYNSEKLENKTNKQINKSSLTNKNNNQYLQVPNNNKKQKVQFQFQENQIQNSQKRDEYLQNQSIPNSQKIDEVFVFTNSWDDTGVQKDAFSYEESYQSGGMSPNFQMNFQQEDNDNNSNQVQNGQNLDNNSDSNNSSTNSNKNQQKLEGQYDIDDIVEED